MITVSVTARRMIAAGPLAAAAALLLAACGSSGGHHVTSAPSGPGRPPASSQGPSASATGSPAAASPPAPPRPAGSPTSGKGLAPCATSSLAVTADTSQTGGAAGSTYVPLDFQNTSNTSCSMYGFPGVSFVTGRGGSQTGAAAARNTQFGSVPVTLSPGSIAHAWLQVAVAGNYPASTCKPVTAHWLRVYPPANTVPAYVSYSAAACSSAKAQILSVMPVRPGRGVRGQAP
ncbi:MAG TPA: DUF4232 domain-containing protein [Streptosporangiaceae bacterium]|nr:DUF4232 domain-containing protein [Streptosporangiaceae bacterium]